MRGARLICVNLSGWGGWYGPDRKEQVRWVEPSLALAPGQLPRGEANMQSTEKGFYTMITRVSGIALAAMTMLAAGAANAQLPLPTSTQFDITGPIQKATLDSSCAGNAHCGGTITIQGHTIVVPKETIV